MQTTERPMTLEEFDALPESNQPIQLIEGQLVVAPSPDRSHQRIVLAIGSAFCAYLQAHPERGEVYQAPFDVQFPGVNVYQPDVMFFAREHLDRLSAKRAMGAPDLVVEVLSPSTAHDDLNEKHLGYAHHRSSELWIVDPRRRKVRIYLLAQDPDRPISDLKGEEVLRTDLLPGFELPLTRLFG